MTASNVLEFPAAPARIPAEPAQPDPSLAALVQYVAGKSRSDIGRLRASKQTEVRTLEAQVALRRGLPDGDNFPLKRDAQRIAEISKEIAYLTELFDRPVT